MPYSCFSQRKYTDIKAAALHLDYRTERMSDEEEDEDRERERERKVRESK